MESSYSAAVCSDLEKQFLTYNLHRPMKVGQYDEGRQLTYTMTTVDSPAKTMDVTLKIERSVGGGFAGQVYKVIILDIKTDRPTGIASGNTYAMKIFIPPSGFSRMFRNLLFAIGFQGSFQLQTNPVAARCGALWQKLIQRAARSRFGDRASVNGIHATFVDSTLGSCGELSDWVEGRTWQLEVDNRMDLLSKWDRGKKVDIAQLGSPEYRAKKEFMHRFVALLHEMGAHEFARQYEWSTWKSQPNCLKRLSTDSTPEKGLIAVDFRAGLALLPFLPMSPGDVKLIFQGLLRGSLVQFDRGSLATLKSFIDAHKDSFIDLLSLLEELEKSERIYRDSLPDITHNHFRLLFSRQLWSTMLSSSVTGWRVQNIIDEGFAQSLKKSPILLFIFWLLGLVPFLGRICRKCIGHRMWRKHYFSIPTNPSYFIRALKGKMAEAAISWHRDGRLTEAAAKTIAGSPGLFCIHLPFSLLPPGLHKFFTSWSYFKKRVEYIAVRPFRLYFNASLREEWLREMVDEGLRKRMLTHDDAREIATQLQEPFIQKYLQSLAVHVMTLPITQVVSVIIAAVYVLTHPELSWQEASATALVIIGAFQVIPISPGSLARGLYVLWLVIRERNFKDYNIAVVLGFLKYVGYLAFPIQMTYRYPTIARFMAAHWATEAVHAVPVFGESGALLEHKIFGVFYNRPLTIRRRMTHRAELRQTMRSRWRHMVPITLCATGALYGIDRWYLQFNDTIPGFKGILSLTFSGIKQLIAQLTSLRLPTPEQLAMLVHYLPFGAALFICGLTGGLVTAGCGGTPLNRRIILAALAGIVTGALYTALSGCLSVQAGTPAELIPLIIGGVWKMFGYTIATTIGAIETELSLPEPAAGQSPHP
ncbi:MAG: hypothetical protein JW913_20800 [Chitinispirillaceae bacterium]|nr:hypothetical protein [Chitinispirillaceae bacterium]